jgi:predicted DCC family thiol-disulfide oxidoreductase YuxK
MTDTQNASANTFQNLVARSGLLSFDSKSLSIFRIAFAIFLACACWQDLLFFPDWYSDDGVLPRFTLLAGWANWTGSLSLMASNDTPIFQTVFCAIYVVALTAFAVGFRARLATIVLIVIRISIYWRNPLITSMIPHIANIFLIWCSFLPLNRYWSIDAALDPEPRDRPFPKIPLLALKLQLGSIYFFSALFKLAGPRWIHGEAILRTLQDSYHANTPLDVWLVANAPGMLVAVNYAVIVFQLLFPFLVYAPFRNTSLRAIALAGAFLMHLTFMLLLHIGTFPLLSICFLLLLVPDAWWNALSTRRDNRLRKVRIFYDSDCDFCKKTGLLLREFCLPATTPVQKASDDPAALALLQRHNSWVLYDAEGKARIKWDAVAYVLRQSFVLFPLGWLTNLPLLRPCMEKIYDQIGANRSRLASITAAMLPWRTSAPPGASAQAFCALLSILALASNLILTPTPYVLRNHQIGWSDKKYTKDILDVAALLQVKQEWGLYAPTIPFMQIHLVTRQTLQDGNQLEYTDQSVYKPHDIDVYEQKEWHHPWLRYFRNLFRERYHRERIAYGKYLCRKLNDVKKNPGKITTSIQLEFYRMHPNDQWPADKNNGNQIEENIPCKPLTAADSDAPNGDDE